MDLWRGMRQVRTSAEFESVGGSELGVMSTTSILDVAVKYAASEKPLLLKLSSSSFMNRGASLEFLSAFPTESEYVYPPLTFLEPTG